MKVLLWKTNFAYKLFCSEQPVSCGTESYIETGLVYLEFFLLPYGFWRMLRQLYHLVFQLLLTENESSLVENKFRP